MLAAKAPSNGRFCAPTSVSCVNPLPFVSFFLRFFLGRNCNDGVCIMRFIFSRFGSVFLFLSVFYQRFFLFLQVATASQCPVH